MKERYGAIDWTTENTLNKIDDTMFEKELESVRLEHDYQQQCVIQEEKTNKK